MVKMRVADAADWLQGNSDEELGITGATTDTKLAATAGVLERRARRESTMLRGTLAELAARRDRLAKEERVPAEVFHPGEFLWDELEARGMTLREFAIAADLSLSLVSCIAMGNADVDPETAAAFARALGVPAEMWLNLQASYGRYTLEAK